MAKSNLAVSTGHIRVLVVYIYIYLLERFTPQSTVLGCLVFTSRATTLLVFPLENTRTYPTPPSFLSFLLPLLSLHDCLLPLSPFPIQGDQKLGWYWRESPVDRTFRGNRDHS